MSPPGSSRKKKRWSYRAGRKGSNRVRAYEARKGLYFIEWYHGGARVREIVAPAHREAAEAAARAKASELAGAVPVGSVTLANLLEAYHEAHDWSTEHRKHQGTYRTFWLDRLGRDYVVGRATTPDVVGRIALSEARKKGWHGRTVEAYLRYIRGAVRWGYRKARWLTADHLDGLEYPAYDSRGDAYTAEELEAISEVARQVDPRFWALWEILRDTGRRLTAVRTLKWEHVDTTDHRTALHFPATTDKARKRGKVFLTRYGECAVNNMVTVPRLGSDWLLPCGALRQIKKRNSPISPKACNKWLRRAEGLAEIEHVPGRAFHGVKRRVVTQLMDQFHGDADAVGQITGNLVPSVLLRTYRQTSDRTRVAAVEALERLRTDT